MLPDIVWKSGKAKASGTKTVQRESFRAGYPADILGSLVQTSRVKDFGHALETLEKKAFGCGHPSPERADVHDPRGTKNFGQNNFGLKSFRSPKHTNRNKFGGFSRDWVGS